MQIDPTFDTLKRSYAMIRTNSDAMRARLGRPLTLSEKILFGHLDRLDIPAPVPGKSELPLRPDRVVFQDVLGQSGMMQFMQTGRDQVAIPTTVHCDHLIQARVGASKDLSESLAENGEVYDFLRSAAARYGCGFWAPGAGIIHQVVLENYAYPGALIIGTDSHTPNASGLGACAIGVGGADAVEAIAGLPWELLYPRRIAVVLNGTLNGWAAPKDVILYVAGKLTVSGGTNAILEYIGPGARTISATGKATITNMGAELGATTSMFPVDEFMLRYLRATGRADLIPAIEAEMDLFQPDPEVEANPSAHYDQVIELNLSELEPYIVGPHSPDRARPLSALAAEVADKSNGFVDEISSALIGSCTNSSYQDMSRAADVARQVLDHGARSAIPFLVTPGSERVRSTIERDGLIEPIEAVGGTVLANACGPCIGQWRRPAKDTKANNTIVTSFNRNFPRRNDGQATTMNFIASPEIVTALSMAGRLSFNPMTDSLVTPDGQAFRLQPPAPAPDVPEQGFDLRRGAYIAPPADGRSVEVEIAEDSSRLQKLRPWAAWDGGDFLDMPILVQTLGKTTTDDISPAGPWLALRGHLDKFSDNMFMGAKNAFTGANGTTVNLLTGARERPIAEVARTYKAAGVKWVAIGDRNYGEGSSREHAALSPRLLGGAAIIARSFARIHETNLKKQGLLPLTFADERDYEKTREADRLSLVNLANLAPGEPVKCVIRHADGTEEVLMLRHSMTERQIGWFRAGSILNTIVR